MGIPTIVIMSVVLGGLAAPMLAGAAEKECPRWLKLVEREVGERKELLGKRASTERARIEQALQSVAPRIAAARSACQAGDDKKATLMALEVWDGFVDEERRDGTLSLNSRLTILELRADRLKAFYRQGWKPNLSRDEEREFLAELDRLDRVLAEVLKRALR